MCKVIVIEKHGIFCLIVWLGKLVLASPSYLILSHFSACSVAALKIGCPSSIEESASKKLVQRVLVLLSQIVQYGLVSPLLWTWIWRTQPRRGVGTGGILFIECKVLECGWVVGRFWSVICGRVPNLVPELGCLRSWFLISIIIKSFKFSNF
jgi:hypothetical protein